jgi:hypothetical protein
MKARRFSVVILAVGLAGCSSEQKPAVSAVESAPRAVATFPASAQLSFGLAPGTCTGGKCPAVVELLAGDTIIDSSVLDFAASSAQFSKGVADKIMGAGDPLADGDALPVWMAGDGENAVSTTARSVKLSPDVTGLLVNQTGGFEHVKRRHYVFISDDNKVKRVWTGEEGAGPAWSATALVDAADGQSQDIVYLTGFQPGGSAPDTVDAKRYSWDREKKALVEKPVGALFAVVAGNFANAGAARTASAQTCLSDYSALPGRTLGIPGTRIVLAALTTQKSLADAALRKVDNCPAGLIRRVVEVKLAPTRDGKD